MEKTKQQKAKDFIINNGVIIVMFILVIYTGLTSDNFLTSNRACTGRPQWRSGCRW